MLATLTPTGRVYCAPCSAIVGAEGETFDPRTQSAEYTGDPCDRCESIIRPAPSDQHGTIPVATYHDAGCWRCPSGVPYGSAPAPHDNGTASCATHYAGVDGDTHACSRPADHPGSHGGGYYR